MGRFTLPSAASQDPRAESLMPPVAMFEGMRDDMLESNMHGAVEMGAAGIEAVPVDAKR